MKILLVITGLGIGGAERVVVNLADKFCGLGNKVMIISLTGPTLISPSDSRIRIVSLQSVKTPIGFIRAYLGLLREIHKFQPDVVHSHMLHANLLTRLVRPFAGIPRLFCTAHNTNEGGRLRMWAYRLTHCLADMSTNVSHEAVVAFEKNGAAPVGEMLAVANGIDTEVFSPDPDSRLEIRSSLAIERDSKIFIAVGRFFEAKDYPNLLEAFSLVSVAIPEADLWIVGDGPLRPVLETMIDTLGLVDRVHLLGVRKDIPGLMRAADVFVLSSAWEGMPQVVGEAMASEKPVVVTDCGGVAEMVGDCGYLVPPHNSEALANAMLKIVALPADQAKLIGRRARQRILDRFSLDRTVDRWLEIYSGKGA